MGWITLFALIVALFLFIQSLFSLYLKTYAWEYPERLFASQAPASYFSARLSFSVLIPARYQGAVMYEAIKRVCSANYPAHLFEIIVICASDDSGTIAEVQRAMRDLGSARIRVVTFSTLPITKPHALQVGFQQSINQVITIFDAGDEINPDIFNLVNTVMMKESAGIVQAGVQITDFKGHWFSIHHCLDYYFWFKSRLLFQEKVGMTPLGESTVFIRRELVERVGGWDEQSISEGANLGLRLSVSRERVHVVYDARYVTRKEAPASLNALMQQRTRWEQGFLQLLWKGSWQSLPRPSQRMLALYTLSFPYMRAIITLLWPLMVAEMFFVQAPVVITMAFYLPLYGLILQFVVSTIGAFLFAREFKLRFSVFNFIGMACTFLPYQLMAGISAVRAVPRQIRKK